MLAGRVKSGALPPSTSASLDLNGYEPLSIDRGGGIDVAADGFHFSFLGRTLATGRIVDWQTRAGPAADQLWRMNLHYMEYLRGVGDDVFAGSDRSMDRGKSALRKRLLV